MKKLIPITLISAIALNVAGASISRLTVNADSVDTSNQKSASIIQAKPSIANQVNELAMSTPVQEVDATSTPMSTLPKQGEASKSQSMITKPSSTNYTPEDIAQQTKLFEEGFAQTDNMAKGVAYRGRNIAWYIDKDNVLHIGDGSWEQSTFDDFSMVKNHTAIVETRKAIIDVSTSGTDMSDMFKQFILITGVGNLTLDTIEGLDKLDTSKTLDMSSMFASQSKIKTLDLSSFNTDNVTDMAGMFLSDSGLEIIDVSNFNTSEVTEMSSMFAHTNASIDVSNFNTSNVLSMFNLFFGATAPVIDVSNFNTSKVTNMSGMFQQTKASVLDVSDFDTRNVTNMSAMFSGTSVSTLDVARFDTSKVTNMYNMFRSSSNLSELDVADWDVSKVTDMSDMFSYLPIESLDLSKWNTPSLTSMDSMFMRSKKIKFLDLNNFDVSHVTSFFWLFCEASALQEVKLDAWNTSNVTTMEGAFISDSNLKKLDVSNWKTGKVTNMSTTFYNCGALPVLDVSNWDTSKVTNFRQTFGAMSSLKNLDTTSFETSQALDLYGTFNALSSIKYFDMSSISTKSATTVEAIVGKNNFKTLKISDKFDLSKITNPDDRDMMLSAHDWYNMASPQYTSTGTDFQDVYNPSTMSGTWTWDNPLVLTTSDLDFGNLVLGTTSSQPLDLKYDAQTNPATISAKLTGTTDVSLSVNDTALSNNSQLVANVQNSGTLSTVVKISTMDNTTLGAKKANIEWTITPNVAKNGE